MQVHAVIPLKRAMRGKTRLARALGDAERTQLVRVMARHVVQAVAAAPEVARVHVLTSDASLAPDYCAQIADREAELNASLAYAARVLRAQGAQALLIVHGDLPFLTTEDVRALVLASAPHAIVVAPDVAEAGTNALAYCLSNDFCTRFGPGSLAAHRLAAEVAGLEFHIVQRRGLAHDIDEPAQLLELLERGGPSYAFLRSAVDGALNFPK
ncbi:MAG TPA: 2-phospho-L-lactate guanylyltransferase [Steroidobacteraceae bacterium]|nr:2-phospho-L-lactate guanylyltransferase [Steroidobacteraceae bacterium]